MNATHSSFRWAAAAILLLVLDPVAMALKNGEAICAEGYIMDNFCIQRGTLLDRPSVVTLDRPDLHSVHCLVDVGVCVGSGFVVLQDPSTVDGQYTLGYEVNGAGTTLLTNLARQVGSCSTCSGGSLVEGFRAGVLGTVLDATANPPLIRIDSAVAVDASTQWCAAQVAPPPNTMAPTRVPTLTPTQYPTWLPTTQPSGDPSSTTEPSATPTVVPTTVPTFVPTGLSTTATAFPTAAPTTEAPTNSHSPSVEPTSFPSFSPSVVFTFSPTPVPSTLSTDSPNLNSFTPTMTTSTNSPGAAEPNSVQRTQADANEEPSPTSSAAFQTGNMVTVALSFMALVVGLIV